VVNSPASIPDKILQYITVAHNIIFTRAWEIKFMAVVAPFRGVRYNPEKIVHLEDVVTPPYDVMIVLPE